MFHSGQEYFLPNLVAIWYSYVIWPLVDPTWPLCDLWPQHCVPLWSGVLLTKYDGHRVTLSNLTSSWPHMTCVQPQHWAIPVHPHIEELGIPDYFSNVVVWNSWVFSVFNPIPQCLIFLISSEFQTNLVERCSSMPYFPIILGIPVNFCLNTVPLYPISLIFPWNSELFFSWNMVSLCPISQ